MSKQRAKEKRPFSVGTLIRVYGHYDYPVKAIVRAHSSTGELCVETDDSGNRGNKIVVHPKQCRRLTPKPKVAAERFRWVSRSTIEDAFWAAKRDASKDLPEGIAPYPVDVLNCMCVRLGLGDAGGDGK